MYARIAILILVSATAISCGDAGDRSNHADTKIRFSLLPDQNHAARGRRFAPLIRYLQDATGLEFEVIEHDGYVELTNAFAKKSIDLAWLGGLTFVIAEQSGNAEPLVMRDVDNRFTSNYIARSDAKEQSVLEFKGQRFAFGSRLSTSGHLMPRHFLGLRGIVPEEFFASVRHTEGHDATVLLVRDGEVDLGVVNHVILQSMIADGQISANELKVLEATPTYTNYVWAVQTDLDPHVKGVLRNAFLALDPNNSDHLKILRAQGAAGYLPAMATDFDDTRSAAEAAGMLDVPD